MEFNNRGGGKMGATGSLYWRGVGDVARHARDIPKIAGICCDVVQWNPNYGCKGTVTTRFALIALVAWQY